jgi:hypothetical protein
MQITLAEPGQPETATVFTLMLVGQRYHPSDAANVTYTVAPDSVCPLCDQRTPQWFTYPATDAAMNPDASPIHAGECCTVCLNNLLSEGIVTIVEIDPDAF